MLHTPMIMKPLNADTSLFNLESNFTGKRFKNRLKLPKAASTVKIPFGKLIASVTTLHF